MATVPTPLTWADTDVVSAAGANAGIKDVDTFLLAKPFAQMRQTSTQTLTNNTWTAVTFTTEDLDSAGGHSNSSNTSRYTAQYAGWYRFSGGVTFASNATGIRGTRWAKNGTALDGSEGSTPAVANTQSVVAKSFLVQLAVGDYVELQAFQSSGGNLNTAASGAAESAMVAEWVSN